MDLTVAKVDRKAGRVEIFAEQFLLTFALVEGKVRLVSKANYGATRLHHSSVLFVPQRLFTVAQKRACAILLEGRKVNESAQLPLFPPNK